MTGIHCSIAGATYAAAARAARTITVVGTAQVDTAQSNFGGASLLLDDSPEAYLTVAHSADLLTGTGAFTVEGWFRPQLAGDAGQGVGTRFWFFKGVNSNTGFGLGVTTDGVRFRGPGQTDLAYTATISNTAFTHIAFVWDGTNKKIYVNGTQQATAVASINVTDTSNYQIGYFTSIFAYNGHIDEIRVSNSLRYSTTFTPSTTPFTFDSDTLLLLHCDGTDASTTFVDDVGTNAIPRTPLTVTANGNAQVDTAQSKFGGASALFDGNGDTLQIATNPLLTIASSADFTIEGYIRAGSVSSTPGLLTDRSSSTSLAGVNFDISIFNGNYITTRTNTLIFETGSTAGSIIIISSNNVFTTNTLYHFAVVRSANVITLYVDGVDVTNNRAGTQSSAIGAGNLTIGGFPNNAAMYTGHLDEIRWSNTARYTAAFTPSASAFVNDRNTVLLLHCDGTDASTTFTDDNA